MAGGIPCLPLWGSQARMMMTATSRGGVLGLKRMRRRRATGPRKSRRINLAPTSLPTRWSATTAKQRSRLALNCIASVTLGGLFATVVSRRRRASDDPQAGPLERSGGNQGRDKTVLGAVRQESIRRAASCYNRRGGRTGSPLQPYSTHHRGTHQSAHRGDKAGSVVRDYRRARGRHR